MTTTELLAAIGEEIERLQQVRSLLAGNDGRKRGPHAATSFAFGDNKPRKKRVMSAAAKARIVAAQKKRWAAWKKKQSASK